jgi:outer membrane PBP1 activator LpoA protein
MLQRLILVISLLSFMLASTTYADDNANPSLLTVQKIALLLPLQGPLAKQGNAVLDGFLAAYYQTKNNGGAVPLIQIYDTSNTTNITKLYETAIEQGANFVVGPLTKSDVSSVVENADLDVPTLVLNQVTDKKESNNLYQFALSPENEAQSIADTATAMGYHQALVISPAGAWGEGIANAFISQWTSSPNQTITKTLYFKNDQNIKTDIADLLNVTQSNARHAALQKLFNEKMGFSARRRADVDVIFINAQPTQARQILPYLSFYYAGNLPTFATGQLYNGTPNIDRDKDLDGVQFPIMPWEIAASDIGSAYQDTFQVLWKNNFKDNSLLYAFGLDAYTLMTQLQSGQAFPTAGILGNTGTLYLNDNQLIKRGLLWAMFKNGQPVLIPGQTYTPVL